MKRKIRAGVPAYTYRQFNQENKQIYRRLAIIIGITAVLILVIWFWGITFVQIIGGLNSKDAEESTDLNIPLTKPTFSSLPEFTNKEKITISGSTTAGVNVLLYLNGTETGKTVTDNAGKFAFTDVSLNEGLNFIKIAASDKSGETQEERATITLDKTEPALTVSEPVNGQVFGKETKNVTIKGTTEPDTTVFINSIQTPIYQNNSFSYVLSVSAGETKIEVRAKDKAGNTKTTNLTVVVKS
ncbi:MAG: hypothetical protein A2172_00395 [Candidatus Woykebacteria bacterium RBG_13_40_15]|uniref:Bacterial Ig-like domain-containing protein n=1 Tax=Candidatus Woykebacteria bacterium RBG_13_40_15 TaxID=1802593 RepID=A0A1G1W9F7_9BACT|nr:MAG: hypothetical protein A2172_00395 [Candidatus Woykebacteria bacterium RBG_13_40_15]